MAHAIMEAGEPKIHRAGQQARNPGDVAILSLKTARESRELETQAEFLRCSLEANCFLGKAAVFVRPSTDWTRPTHTVASHLLYSSLPT